MFQRNGLFARLPDIPQRASAKSTYDVFKAMLIQNLAICAIMVVFNDVIGTFMTSFKQDDLYNDLDCSAGIALFSYADVASGSECAFACIHHFHCAAFAYNYDSKTCDLLRQKVTDPGSCSNLIGNIYIQRESFYGTACSSTNECPQMNLVCQGGACQCKNGFSFLPDTGECVDGDACTFFGTSFQHNPNFVESGGGFYADYTYSVQTCKDLCINHGVPNKTCRGVQYWKTQGKCGIQDHTMLQAGANYKPNPAWDVYTRDCE